MREDVYHVGYSGWSNRDLLRAMNKLDTRSVLVDVRYRARSRRGEFNYGSLLNFFGRDRYIHIPELGNINYNNGGPIKLANPYTGRGRLAMVPRDATKIFMCQCPDFHTCHRRQVLDYVYAGNYDEVELEEPSPLVLRFDELVVAYEDEITTTWRGTEVDDKQPVEIVWDTLLNTYTLRTVNKYLEYYEVARETVENTQGSLFNDGLRDLFKRDLVWR